MTEDPVSLGLSEIERELRSMVAGEVDTYAAGRRVWEIAFGLATKSHHLMWPLWLLWGGLTDAVELHPDEKPRWDEAMLRAAHEWLELDAESRTAYFDRWLYGVLGLPRETD